MQILAVDFGLDQPYVIAVLRTIMARLRIDQMMAFCWKILAPLAFVQIIVCVVLKGVLS